ncbi:hypothetical protein MSTO_33590 [Mycobacterium stomatepiae]|uniref:DUF7159 domain-containing protein n=1 Tax=Mycobacterium stomatepiae TaxID=470076 RepID=A0A7I7QA13_9MYCO|nr:hypothetical protein MSTO_33590 [Mycobacterium stomatepiae]
MDIVLGVSIAPDSVQMVLVEGENADGALVEEDEFDVTATDYTEPTAVPDRVISAILGTREGAADAGLELSSIGVTWTDQLHAAVLRDALASYKLENVMLVSAFLAATALGQSVGGAMGYETTAVLFVEPDTATLAIVETADGSISEFYRERLDPESDEEATAQLTGMLAGLEEQDLPPGGVFVVGSGVNIAAIKPALESATALNVNTPEEPETALARGAALASANAPLFASSTAALAYAQDPGTGAVQPDDRPEYLGVTYVSDATLGRDELAYSLVSDEDADAPTVVIDPSDFDGPEEGQPRRRPVLLVGSGMAVVAISAVVALEIALAIGIRTTNVAVQPSPNQNLIVPSQPAPAPAGGGVRRQAENRPARARSGAHAVASGVSGTAAGRSGARGSAYCAGGAGTGRGADPGAPDPRARPGMVDDSAADPGSACDAATRRGAAAAARAHPGATGLGPAVTAASNSSRNWPDQAEWPGWRTLPAAWLGFGWR